MVREMREIDKNTVRLKERQLAKIAVTKGTDV